MSIVFEPKERAYEGAKSYIESDYEYLDRSSRIESTKVRDYLNCWIDQFPEEEANELITRIRSGDKRNYDSAVFEILLFSIMTSLGCKLEIHPDLNNGSSKHPDFLVTTPEGEEFYLEAVLASEYSAAEVAAEKRKNVVLNSLEQLDSPNFLLGINASGNPDSPPKGRILRNQISNWLDNLNPDDVIRDVEEKGHDAIPTWQWSHDGWDISFEAIPIKPDRRGGNQRVIGVLSGGVRWINGWEPIRDALRSKGNRYGELDKPLVVAVNVDAFNLDKIDEMQALFGQEEYVFIQGEADGQPEMRRQLNGLWYGRQGPVYTRISGAWLFGALTPWNIVSRKNTLYFNPWTAIELPEILKSLNHAFENEGKMNWVETMSLGKLLGLSDSWPE